MGEYPKLPPDFKEKWVAALRSGSFKQGEQFLYTASIYGEQYCCLGVACSVAGVPRTIMEEVGVPRDIKEYAASIEKVPGMLKEEAGFGIVGVLTAMNDGVVSRYDGQLFNENKKKYSFDEIADFIEKEL